MIGLMDCNNFFVSCERLFRPDLRGKPVAVLSSNDGCIVARSQEVKDLGIPMGVPLFEVNDIVKAHQITLFSSNFSLYRDISSRVMLSLQEEFDAISVYSIDEAFFDVPHDMGVEDIRAIRERIMTKTGIPVSFGIAPTKTIAKLANTEAKKGTGVTWLTQGDAETRYVSVSCGSVWGIGRQLSRRLGELGIHTVAEMLEKGLRFMRSEFGVHGERLYLELTGTPVQGSDHELSPGASIMSTRSFSKAVTEKQVLLSAIGHHITHVCEKLRERGLKASTLTIICAPSRYGSYALRTGSQTIILEEPTHDTHTLLRRAAEFLDTHYDPEVPYKKAGAVVSGLIPDACVATSLFGAPSVEESYSAVYGVIDALNRRFGRDTVHAALIYDTKTWAAHAKLRSPEYTTQWSEIVSVKAI